MLTTRPPKVPEASMLTTRPPKVPEASMLTTRPPKPLGYSSTEFSDDLITCPEDGISHLANSLTVFLNQNDRYYISGILCVVVVLSSAISPPLAKNLSLDFS
jgi:hypothetical protein